MLLVRVTLSHTVGPRPAGTYIVEDIEACEMQLSGALERVEAVVPQVDHDDDDVIRATAELVADLFPPPPATDVDGDTATTTSDEAQP